MDGKKTLTQSKNGDPIELERTALENDTLEW
jgi:hypothetical protein